MTVDSEQHAGVVRQLITREHIRGGSTTCKHIALSLLFKRR